MTTALYLLRCKQMGFSLWELEYLSTGQVFDVFTESSNDSAKYARVASQEDFDRL